VSGTHEDRMRSATSAIDDLLRVRPPGPVA